MDSSEGPAQRPVTLDITDVAEPDRPQDPVPDPAEASSTSTIPASDVLFPEESIDLGGEPFSSPQDDSLASGSLMDKLNDQMMESVMISDSPNNSEEDDVVPMDSLLEQFDESQTAESKEPEEGEEEEVGEKTEPEVTEEQTTTEIKMESPEESSTTAGETSLEEKLEEKKGDESQEVEKVTSVSVQLPEDSPVSGSPKAQDADLGTSQQTPKEEPIPVCTIFSQGQPPKTLVPDGFQPTLVKSPSFSSGSGSGAAETPSKLAPLVCQPSPSLSKFFSDNGGVNPASDFFDSFTTSSSFISVSNPNAESPKAPATPEHQLPSSLSSSTSPVMPTAAPPQETTSTPSSYFATPPADGTPKPLSAGPAEATPPFSKLQAVFSGSDDPFATALSTSEVDRRYDAWLPSEETRKVLISVATQQINTVHVERERLSMPGLKFDNLQVSFGSISLHSCIVKVVAMPVNTTEC